MINSSQIARWVGWTFLAFIIYAMISAVVFLLSLILLQKEITPDLPWITTAQRKLYFAGARKIWQAQTDCVEFDKDVIYKPKLGSCQFNNAEFKTEQHFASDGRYTGLKPAGMGIAVVGDSHAMGWGVADEETFAARLQQLSNRPVYNLAVSSYGTIRELIRLEQSGLLSKVDTIIIQYCDNDLEENMNLQPTSLQATQQKFVTITQSYPPSRAAQLKYLKKGYWATFNAPFSSLRRHLSPKPAESFSRHYQPFINAFKQHPELKDKRIIIFYSNAHGQKFKAYPAGKDPQLTNLEFVDLDLDNANYYPIDDHLTSAGHNNVAQRLFELIQPIKPKP